MRKTALAVLSVLTLSGVAHAESSLNEKYASNFQGAWKFQYGPMNEENKTVALSQEGRNGINVFQCRNNGDVSYALKIAGLKKDIGDKTLMIFRVGNVEYNIAMTAMANGHELATAWQSDPDQIINILGILHSLMGIRVKSDTLVSITSGDYVLKLKTDNYQDIATTYALCRSWNQSEKIKDGTPISQGIHKPNM